MEPVKYKEMLAEAANQMQQRAGLLSKRVFLVIWPLLILIGILSVASLLSYEAIEKYIEMIPFFWGVGFLGFLFLFAICYGVIMGMIFHTEKIIWIDSYFDGRNLTPEQSWRIAKRLFVSTLKLSMVVILRYCLPALLLLGVGILLLMPLSGYIKTGSEAAIFWGGISIASLFLIPVAYLYVISIKLRFMWFLFLDTYGTGISWHDFFAELKKLNSVAKSDSVVKTIVADFGAGTVSGIASMLMGGVQQGIGQLGPGAHIAGEIMGTYTSSVTNEMTSLGRSAAVYLLYCYAREQLHHTPQHINEALYKLVV